MGCWEESGTEKPIEKITEQIQKKQRNRLVMIFTSLLHSYLAVRVTN
jgi:hypothetical protein